MNKGEDIIQFALEVHKDNGMHAESAGRIGATALSWCFVYINQRSERPYEQGKVIFAEGLKCFKDDLACFFVGKRQVDIIYDWHI